MLLTHIISNIDKSVILKKQCMLFNLREYLYATESGNRNLNEN